MHARPFAQPVGRKVEHNAVKPSADLRFAIPPVRRNPPQTQHGLLRYILSLGALSEQPKGLPEHARGQSLREYLSGLPIALGIAAQNICFRHICPRI
jgi:hypothetical protein